MWLFISGGLFNTVSAVANSVIGGLVGIGHDVEQGKKETNTLSELTNLTGAGGRADMHGWSLPLWVKEKGTNK